MWEEKPALIKAMEAKWKLGSLTARGGSKEPVAGDATLVTCPGEQQSMGHFVLSSATVKLEADSAGAASWW